MGDTIEGGSPAEAKSVFLPEYQNPSEDEIQKIYVPVEIENALRLIKRYPLNILTYAVIEGDTELEHAKRLAVYMQEKYPNNQVAVDIALTHKLLEDANNRNTNPFGGGSEERFNACVEVAGMLDAIEGFQYLCMANLRYRALYLSGHEINQEDCLSRANNLLGKSSIIKNIDFTKIDEMKYTEVVKKQGDLLEKLLETENGRMALDLYAFNAYDNLMNPKRTDENTIAPSNYSDVAFAKGFLIPLLELINSQDNLKMIKRAVAFYDDTTIEETIITRRNVMLGLLQASSALGSNYFSGIQEKLIARVSQILKIARLSGIVTIKKSRVKGLGSVADKLIDLYSKGKLKKPEETVFTPEWYQEVLTTCITDMNGIMLEIDIDKITSLGGSKRGSKRSERLKKIFEFSENEDKNVETRKNIARFFKAFLRHYEIGEYYKDNPKGMDDSLPETKLKKNYRNVSWVGNIEIDENSLPVDIQIHFKTVGKSSYGEETVGKGNHFLYKLKNAEFSVEEKEALISLFKKISSAQAIYSSAEAVEA